MYHNAQHFFSRLVRAVDAATQGASPPVDASPTLNRDTWKHHFRHGHPSAERVYDRHGRSYARRYMLSNILKNFYVLRELSSLGMLRDSARILDIGAGPGSFALAYLMLSETSPAPGCAHASISMREASSQQLDIFHDIWNSVAATANQPPALSVSRQFIAGSFLAPGEEYDLIVLSNSAIEILRNPAVDTEAFLLDLLRSGAAVVVIDYEYGSVASHLNRFAFHAKQHSVALSMNGFPVRHDVFDAIDLGDISHSCFGYLDIPPFARRQLRFLKTVLLPLSSARDLGVPQEIRLIYDYKRAWERHDTSLLQEIFCADAVYSERSDQPPMLGIKDIARYWQTNATQQRHVDFRPFRLVLRPGGFDASWECQFQRLDLSSGMHLYGTMSAAIANGRICRFEETFCKRLFDWPAPSDASHLHK